MKRSTTSSGLRNSLKRRFFVLLLTPSLWSAAIADNPEVAYDESKQGDLAPAKKETKSLFKISKPGVYVVRGHGTDSSDDVDAFVFEVAEGKTFDFCLVAGAAEFKWLRAVEKDGSTRDIAFGSTNLSFRVPRSISKNGLPAGKYRVEMMFGPDGAAGDWIVKIASGVERKPGTPLCVEAVDPTSAEKMKSVSWPGIVTIFHGHNWGSDEKYVVAIKEAGFTATGSTEAQIEHCRKNGLRAFVFIWPHEAGTIPAKHAKDSTVLCYYLSDRVRPSKWGVWANLERKVFEAAPKHPAVFTMRGLWGSIDRYCEAVRGRVLEYYHYHWDGNRSPHSHFVLLEQFRQASAKNGYVPICRIVETRAEDMRKTRQTIFTSLAYGVRAFRTGGRGIFQPDKRDARGVPTRNAFGDEFLRINKALRAYSPVFERARCQDVWHAAPLPPGGRAAPEDAWVKPEGEGVLVGVFQEERKQERVDYLLVANRDSSRQRTATLRFDQKNVRVSKMDRETAKWISYHVDASGESAVIRLELEAGGGELLEVSR